MNRQQLEIAKRKAKHDRDKKQKQIDNRKLGGDASELRKLVKEREDIEERRADLEKYVPDGE